MKEYITHRNIKLLHIKTTKNKTKKWQTRENDYIICGKELILFI